VVTVGNQHADTDMKPAGKSVPERPSAPGPPSKKPKAPAPVPVIEPDSKPKKKDDDYGEEEGEQVKKKFTRRPSMPGLRQRNIRVRRKPKLPSYVVSNNVEWSENSTDSNTLWLGYKSFDRFEVVRLTCECLVRKILAPYKLDIPSRDTPLTGVRSSTSITGIEKGMLSGYTMHYIKTTNYNPTEQPAVHTGTRINFGANATNTFNSIVEAMASQIMSMMVNHNILHRIDVLEVDNYGTGSNEIIWKTVRTIENIGKYRMDLKVLANFRIQNVTRGGTHVAGQTDESTNEVDNLHAAPISGKVYTFSDLTPRFNNQFVMEKTKNGNVDYKPTSISYVKEDDGDDGVLRRRDYKLDTTGFRDTENGNTQDNVTYKQALLEWRRPLSYPTQVFKNCSGIDSVSFKPGFWRAARMQFTFNGTYKQLITGMYFGQANSLGIGTAYRVQPSTGKCMVLALTNTIRNRTNEIVSVNVNSRYNYMCSMIPPKRRNPPQQRTLLEHTTPGTGFRQLGSVIT
jgi:hypothetical protein